MGKEAWEKEIISVIILSLKKLYNNIGELIKSCTVYFISRFFVLRIDKLTMVYRFETNRMVVICHGIECRL